VIAVLAKNNVALPLSLFVMKRDSVGLVHISFEDTLAALEFVCLQTLVAWVLA
jgi:hypothetical protein